MELLWLAPFSARAFLENSLPHMALSQSNKNNPNFEGIDEKWELYMTKQKLYKNPLS